MRPHSQNNSGFSLVEMLVVLALLSIAIAVSIPYIRTSGQNIILKAEAIQLANYFRTAHTHASQSNAIVIVKLDRETGIWSADGFSKTFKLSSAIDLKALTIADEVSTANIGFRFFLEGGNSGGRLVLKRDGDRVEIALNWLTGAIACN